MIFNSEYNFQQIASGIIVPVLALLIGLGVYFFLLPAFQEIGAKSEALETEKAELAETVGSLDEVKALVAEYEEKKDDLQILNNTIPKAPEIPELLANIEYLADQSGLVMSSLQVSPAVTLETSGSGESVSELERLRKILDSSQELSAMDVDVVLQGRYQNIKAFLTNLEQNQRLMDINEMVFGNVDEETGLQEYTLTLQTYYQSGS